MERLLNVKLKGLCSCGHDRFDVKSVFGSNINIPTCTKCGKLHIGPHEISIVVDEEGDQ